MMSQLKSEKCNSCVKNIRIGQSITECAKCLNIIHTRCFSKSKFRKINEKLYCQVCQTSIVVRYNPFKKLGEEFDTDSEHFFDQDPISFTGELQEASKVLENCGNFISKEVTNFLNDHNNNFNTYFYNIDGNKTNFNTFAAELKKVQGDLAIIGIAETNVNSDQKELFPLNEHNSFYSDKLDGKKSGTGLGLYIHEKFNTTKNTLASVTLPHLESLFLNVTKDKITVNVGVVYRPPSGSHQDFLNDLKNIIRTLPKTITYLMGDFNLDLHKGETSSHVELFEEFFISEGLFPVISIATHQNPSTKNKSCIDNIFTNDIEAINQSGIIESFGTAHLPIFSTSRLNYDSKPNKREKIAQYYCFSKKILIILC